jgi:single stranded DNA-binding protein
MKGIETAFFGVIGSDTIELKTSRSGTPWASFSAGVTTGTTDDGKDILQWVRVSCFAETAERVAASFKKNDRCYVEGSLKLDHWTDKQGEQKHGLSVSAFKVEKVGVSAIGRNKPKREADQNNGTITASSFVGPSRERPQVQGRDRFEFNDDLTF